MLWERLLIKLAFVQVVDTPLKGWLKFILKCWEIWTILKGIHYVVLVEGVQILEYMLARSFKGQRVIILAIGAAIGIKLNLKGYFERLLNVSLPLRKYSKLYRIRIALMNIILDIRTTHNSKYTTANTLQLTFTKFHLFRIGGIGFNWFQFVCPGLLGNKKKTIIKKILKTIPLHIFYFLYLHIHKRTNKYYGREKYHSPKA